MISYWLSASSSYAGAAGGLLSGNITTLKDLSGGNQVQHAAHIKIDSTDYIYYSRTSTNGLQRNTLSGTDTIQTIRLSIDGAAYNNFASSSFHIVSHPTLPILYVFGSSSINIVSVNSGTDHSSTTFLRSTLGFTSAVSFSGSSGTASQDIKISEDGTTIFGVIQAGIFRFSLDPVTGIPIAGSGVYLSVGGTNYHRAVCQIGSNKILAFKITQSNPGIIILQELNMTNLTVITEYSPLPSSTFATIRYTMFNISSTDVYFNSDRMVYYYKLGGSGAIELAGNVLNSTNPVDGSNFNVRFFRINDTLKINGNYYLIDNSYLRQIT